MDKAEFLSKITEIGTCEDDATRRALLTDLSDNVSPIFDNVDTLTQTNSDLTAANQELQEKNMQLFLKVGESRQPNEPEVDPPAEKRKFENLFNEKGELK